MELTDQPNNQNWQKVQTSLSLDTFSGNNSSNTSICKQHAFQHSNTQNIDKLGKQQLGTGLLKTARISHDYNNTSSYPIKNQ